MRQSVRVIVFNGDEEYSATIRSDLLSLEGVQIVAEVEWFSSSCTRYCSMFFKIIVSFSRSPMWCRAIAYIALA